MAKKKKVSKKTPKRKKEPIGHIPVKGLPLKMIGLIAKKLNVVIDELNERSK